MRFNTFDDPELLNLMDACWDWTQAFKDKRAPRWLSILGNCGTGKTHCCQRLFNWAQLSCDWSNCDFIHQPIYWPDFMQRLRSGNAFDMRNDMKRWPVLFLDDIGAERDTTGFAIDELNTLLGCRMNRWTLLTSNCTLQKLASIDERITSRLFRDENRVVCCLTQDYSARNAAAFAQKPTS